MVQTDHADGPGFNSHPSLNQDHTGPLHFLRGRHWNIAFSCQWNIWLFLTELIFIYFHCYLNYCAILSKFCIQWSKEHLLIVPLTKQQLENDYYLKTKSISTKHAGNFYIEYYCPKWSGDLCRSEGHPEEMIRTHRPLKRWWQCSMCSNKAWKKWQRFPQRRCISDGKTLRVRLGPQIENSPCLHYIYLHPLPPFFFSNWNSSGKM